MDEVVLIKVGEMILKGHNRKNFEEKLLNNIRDSLKNKGKYKIWKAQATFYIQPLDESASMAEAVECAKKIFGITKICPAYIALKNMESIYSVIGNKLSDSLKNAHTFKAEAKRADKSFPLKSPEIASEAGGFILSKFRNLKVDVNNPDLVVNIDIREDNAFVYCDRINGAGGLPTGMSGKCTLLLSGGIDSPVAGWLMAKRGVNLEAVNFFSYPYTSQRAKEKVIALKEILEQYAGSIPLHIVPFTDIQMEINDKCPKSQMTIIMRRFMNRISQEIALKNGSSALVTGESLAQVASQTLQSMVVTNEVAKMPVLRPLVGLDKIEIIEYARKIGTYDTSILPYEDCCTIFVPKNPDLKPKLEKIRESESKLDVEGLVKAAVEGTETIG